MIVSFFDELAAFMNKEKKSKEERCIDAIMDVLYFACVAVELPAQKDSFRKIIGTTCDYAPTRKSYIKLMEITNIQKIL